MTEHVQSVVRVHDTDVHYEIAGQGHPLLLVHGGLGDSRMWNDQFDPFARHFRTIRFDLPGFGRSGPARNPFRGHEFLADLLAALDVRSAYVVGISLGGRFALDFTLSHPGMVDALVLVASGIGGRPPSGDLVAASSEADEAYEQGDLDRAVELELRLWIDGPMRTPDQVASAVRERVREMNRDNWLRAAEGPEPDFLTPPAVDRLSEIDRPVLVIVGGGDIADMQDNAASLARGIPRARNVVIDSVGHHPNMERPTEFNRAVTDFLLNVEQRRADEAALR